MLAAISGLELVEDFRWCDAAKRWALQCRLTADVLAGGPVPEVTEWYLLADPNYPRGDIDLFPAKAGGLDRTFHHQAFNGEGRPELPWRTGKLCLVTDLAVLRRQGFDPEPFTARERLDWYIKRALDWLSLASRNELVKRGDYFELPAFPTESGRVLVFAESPASLGVWMGCPERCGLVRLSRVKADKPLVVVHAFETMDGQEILGPRWGAFIRINERPAPVGAWLLVDRPIVLPPWQAPATWGELREQLAGQGVDLQRLLARLSPRLRDHGLSPEKRPGHLLLLGFSIPEKEHESPFRVHWLAVELPPLSAGDTFARGFRKDELGYRRRDARLLGPDRPLKWVPTECWDKDELSGRGRLGPGLRGKDVALIGAGALGSVIGGLLVRGGVDDMTIFDPDLLEAGNLVRHPLGLARVGRMKANALARALEQAAPSVTISGVDRKFPDELVDCDRADIVLDATGEDDVLFDLQRYPWTRDHWFASLWVGMHARRIYCFSVRGSEFPADVCLDLFAPWQRLESRELGEKPPPRPGIGCWNPVFPARADDIWLGAAILVKHLDRLLTRDEAQPSLAVFEQSANPDSPGIRRIPSQPEVS